MKRIIFAGILLISVSSFAQTDVTGIHIPMKNGVVFYEKTFPLNASTKKEDVYGKALKWFSKTFKDSRQVLKVSDKKSGKIEGTGLFKIVVNDAGNYYWIKETIAVTSSDSGCTFQAYDFYEKPIMPGVTNDFSKIEYRWWDTRKGKPWNAFDQKLFEGLNREMLGMMEALEKEVHFSELN